MVAGQLDSGLNRFRAGGYSAETSIQLEDREAILSVKESEGDVDDVGEHVGLSGL